MSEPDEPGTDNMKRNQHLVIEGIGTDDAYGDGPFRRVNFCSGMTFPTNGREASDVDVRSERAVPSEALIVQRWERMVAVVAARMRRR